MTRYEKAAMREVFIDGVRYVPIVNAAPLPGLSPRGLMRALALTYTTPEHLDANEAEAFTTFRVTVGEDIDGELGDTPTIADFVAEVLRQTYYQEPLH